MSDSYISDWEEYEPDGSVASEVLTKVFTPEMYGAKGNGITDDTEAVQAAIDAAGNSGGGTVRCDKDYNIASVGGSKTLGLYPNNYGLYVPYDHVDIIGAGTFRLNAKPNVPTGTYTMILLGRESSGLWPGENGDWQDHNKIDGLTFDLTALTDAERDELSSYSTGGIVCPLYCRYTKITNNVFLSGFGANGVVAPQFSSRRLKIVGNHFYAARHSAIWLDGTRYSVIADNFIDSAKEAGINMANNTDNFTQCGWNIVANNYIKDQSGVGIYLMGTGNKATGNIIRSANSFTIGYIGIGSSKNSNGDFPAFDNIVAHNTIIRPSGNPALVGIYVNILGGSASNSGNMIAHNYINERILTGISFGAGVSGNKLVQGELNFADTSYSEVETGTNTIL